MTRLQNTPYDRLAAPGSIAETRERVRSRAERMTEAARRAEFEGLNRAPLALWIAEHVATRLARHARERNVAPEALAAVLVAEGLAALEAGAFDGAADDAADRRAEIVRLKGKVVGLERAAQTYRAQRDEARAGIRAAERRGGGKTAAADAAMLRADAAAREAAAALAAKDRAHAQALAERDLEIATARSVIDDLRATAARLEKQGAAPRDDAGAAPAGGSSGETPKPGKSTAKPKGQPKGKPYRWPRDFGR